MNLVLLGAPGAGKGTQAQKLVAEFGFAHISTGDLLRSAVAAQTPLGLQVKEIMTQGKLVSDDIVIKLVQERLACDDAKKGFILDGFPRTIDQAVALDKLLSSLSISLDAALYVNVATEAIITRLSSRRTCKSCGYTAGADTTVCPSCSSEMIQRPDDTPAAIQIRLDAYYKQTAPLVSFYEDACKLKEVDGDADPDVVYAEVKRQLSL